MSFKKLPVSGTKKVLVERVIAGGAGALHDNYSRQNEEVPTFLSVLMNYSPGQKVKEELFVMKNSGIFRKFRESGNLTQEFTTSKSRN